MSYIITNMIRINMEKENKNKINEGLYLFNYNEIK